MPGRVDPYLQVVLSERRSGLTQPAIWSDQIDSPTGAGI